MVPPHPDLSHNPLAVVLQLRALSNQFLQGKALQEAGLEVCTDDNRTVLRSVRKCSRRKSVALALSECNQADACPTLLTKAQDQVMQHPVN